MRPFLSVDCEYNQPNELHMGLVSVDFCSESGRQESIWLKDSPEGKAKAVRILTRIKDTHTLVSHAVTAEASCLIALGLNPRDFQWFDTYLEYTQLQNANLKYLYGWHYRESLFTGGWTQSFPLFKASDLLELDETFGEDREKFMERAKADGRNHEEVTPSLLHALKNILGIEIDVHQKNTTRALILERKPEYSEEEKAQILGYGASDTRHLIALARELKRLVGGRLEKIKPLQEAELDQIILWRGRAAANVAVYTMTGIPISRTRLDNLVSQKRTVIHEAIRNFQATVYALWEFDRKDSEWHIKTARCNAWAESLIAKYGMAWPKGAKGDYSMSTASGFPLDEYWGISDEIKAYRHVTELIKGLGYHATDDEAITRKAAGKRLFRDSLGSDDRVRPYYGPYGTQTGRNAPQATSFIFAQAGWLRGLVEPKPGHILAEIDFSSQEAFIAAVLSKDPALMKAYMSGDPYLAFAISAGAAPKDATKKSHTDIRNLFKSTVLGLQYGMGSKKLSVKLTADTGKQVSVEKAKELINLHRQVYHVYYSWKDRLWERYRSGKPVSLADGWYLDLHSDSKLSTLNMPVQGSGSAIMRQMIDILLGLGIKVVCPVHDSVIYECREEEAESIAKIVGDAMLEACYRVCGEHGMRVGQADVLRHGEFWETEKNAEALRSNRKYMEFAPEFGKVESYLDLFLK